VDEWKSLILEAVGLNGQVVIEILPELEKVVGKQQPVPELGPSEAQNRFKRFPQASLFQCVVNQKQNQ